LLFHFGFVYTIAEVQDNAYRKDKR
jgi:hypothetical protein